MDAVRRHETNLWTIPTYAVLVKELIIQKKILAHIEAESCWATQSRQISYCTTSKSKIGVAVPKALPYTVYM